MEKKIKEKLLNIVQKNYEEIADDFSRTRSRPMWPEVIKLANNIKDNSYILDFGCGNGRLLNAWKRTVNIKNKEFTLGYKNIRYFGIDSSKNLIKIAKEKHPKENFLVKNLTEINNWKIEKKFDYIFLIAVLQHIPEQKERIKILQNLKNLLNPNGKIIMSNWNLWASPKHKKKLYIEAAKKIIGQNKMDFGDILFNWGNEKSLRYYHAFTKRALKKISLKSGYKIEKLYKDKHNYYTVLSIKTS